MIERSKIWQKPDTDSSLSVWRKVRTWMNGVLSVVFPTFCLHCWRSFSGSPGRPLCERCLALVDTPEGGRCYGCGQFLGPATSSQTDCKNCRDHDFSFERVYALGRYTPPLRTWIHMMKFKNRPVLGYTLGRKLGEKMEEKRSKPEPSFITAIPLTPYREAKRWFNQAQLIAFGVNEVTGIPVETDQLVKTTSTTPQVELTRRERFENIKPEVFDVRNERKINGADVLVVDDVMTTGSTLDAAGKVLKNNGAASVQVAVLGR